MPLTVCPGRPVAFDPLFLSVWTVFEKVMNYSAVWSIYLSSLLSPSVQEPSMQGVQISNGGQQVDACSGTNGRVHIVL